VLLSADPSPIACIEPTGMVDVSPKFSPDGLILYLAEHYSMCQSIFFSDIIPVFFSRNKLPMHLDDGEQGGAGSAA